MKRKSKAHQLSMVTMSLKNCSDLVVFAEIQQTILLYSPISRTDISHPLVEHQLASLQ